MLHNINISNTNGVWNYRGAAYYYIVDTSSNWDTAISQAAQNWFKTGYHTNPLYPMTRTYTRTDSPIDFYKNNNLPYGTNGETTFFIKGRTQVNITDGELPEPTQNWLYCKIYINEDFFKIYNGNDATRMKVLILHEMGHVFGLQHNDETSSVMYPYLEPCTATKVTEFDSKGLVTKLGGV